MNMIENHMEQISASASAISDLPFPAPRMFTNALLHTHDITALIRDVESHERALFKPVAPEPGSIESYTRRSTYFHPGHDPSKTASALENLKLNSAVGRILGGDMLDRIKRADKLGGGGGGEGTGVKDVDIEALLAGAERLSEIYPVPGAVDRIKALRSRHAEMLGSIEYYESKVAKQTVLLDRVHHGRDHTVDHVTASPGRGKARTRESYSAADFEQEEAEMRELEEKRKNLQDRVVGMQKDLGGLRR